MLGFVALLVREYDEAIAYFTAALGFTLVEDTPRAEGKRWVVVAPPGGGTALLLARAVGPEQEACVGRQAGGRVFLFLYTDDFPRDYHAMQARGVMFEEQPRREEYGRAAFSRALYGTRGALLEGGPAPPPP